MPAAVGAWIETRSLLDVQRVQSDLLATFRDDFGKYRRRLPEDRLAKVFAALPRLVGKKFVAARVDRDERAGAIKDAFRLLALARVCTPVRRSASSGVPLGAEADDEWFKVCLLDTGLYATQVGLDATALVGAAELTLVNEGQLAEQFVGQELRAARAAHQDPELYCWVREQRTSSAEVDYVMQHGTRVVPVEVKAGATGRLRSLHVFVQEKRRRLGVRLWTGPLRLDDVDTAVPTGKPARFRLLSVPLYAAGQLRRLVQAATERGPR
jgi:predicted AAA+ superfamily ATPase